MKEKFIVTKEMVDYVESHREGERVYGKSFKLTEGEEAYVIDVSDRGNYFYVQASCVAAMPTNLFGLNPQELLFKKKMEKELYDAIEHADWIKVRNETAITVLGALLSNRVCYDRLARNEDAYTKAADVAVSFADRLVERLQRV